MPVVRIDWFTGRSKAQKEELARRIEEAMVEVGCCKRGQPMLSSMTFTRGLGDWWQT